jgi:(S)-sulfolactate dehydrogenase
MKIVIAEFMDEVAVATLRARFDTRYEPTLVDRRAELLPLLAGASALIVRNRTQVDAALLEAAPGLRVIGRLGVGLDNIDVPACTARGITVIPATGANAGAVAEYVLGTAMALLRLAYTRSTETAAGDFAPARQGRTRPFAGKTLGLIGFGGIGQLTARLAQGLCVNVIAHDPMIDDAAPVWQRTGVVATPLAVLLAQSDIISLHVPLTTQTRNLIDHTALARMKPGALLINSARGGIVDEVALAAALRSGHLGGAAIDVYDEEPLVAGTAFAGLANLILTPHIAGVTLESNVRVSALIAERVAAQLQSAALK